MSLSRRGFVGKVAGLTGVAMGLVGVKLSGSTKIHTDFTFASVLRESPYALPHRNVSTWNRHHAHVYLDGERVTRDEATLSGKICVEADTKRGYVIFKDIHSQEQSRQNGRVQILFKSPELRKEYMERYGKYDRRYLA